MGYASTIPSGVSHSTRASTQVTVVTMTNAKADYSLGTFRTPNFKQPLSIATADLSFLATFDSSGAENYVNTADLPYLQLIPTSGTTINCGLVPRYLGMTKASSYGGMILFTFPNNIATDLQPDMVYEAKFKDIKAVGNNLVFYTPNVEIQLIFGM